MKRSITLIFSFFFLIFTIGCDKEKKVYNNDNSIDNNVDNVDISKKILDIIDNELGMYLKYSNINDITNQDKLIYIYNEYVSDYGEEFDLKEFPASSLQKYFTDSSIIDLGYKNENIYCSSYYGDKDHILWNYDEIADKYILNESHSAHDEVSYVLADKVVEYKNNNNRYTIFLNYLFGDTADDENSIDLYGSYTDFVSKNNKIATISRDSNKISFSTLALNYLNNNYDNIKDKLDYYEYTFVYSNNKIKLVDFNVNQRLISFLINCMIIFNLVII